MSGTGDPYEAAGFGRAGSGFSLDKGVVGNAGVVTGDSAAGDPVTPDPYEAAGFGRAGQVKPKDAIKALGEGAAGGFLETVGVVPGVVGGAAIGTAVAPFFGPFAPAAPVVGGIGGGVYGWWAGNKAKEGFGLRSPDEMSPELRPYAFGGESFGGSMGALGVPYGAVATGFRFGTSEVGKLFNRIIETAKRAPVRFGLVEGSMALSAASAAATAEDLFPGNVGARMGAELVGGAVNPAKLVRGAGEYGWNLVRNVVQSVSPEGRTTASAKLLADVAAKTGEDLDAVWRVYKALGVPGLENLTPAQKTGSMALGALEDHLAEFSGKFDKESKDRAIQGLDVLRGHIALLTRTGDPEALKTAAQVRDIYYRTLIQGRVDSAMAEATAAVGKITKDTPETRAVLSTKVREILDLSIKDARKAESELWARWTKAEGDTPVKYDNLLRQFTEEYEKVLPEYRPKRVPGEVEAFLRRVRKGGEPSLVYDPETLSFKDVAGKAPGTTAGEMYKLRGELLNEARQMAIAGDHSSARSFNDMAEAILDDLGESVSPAGRKLYDEARGFTKEFHDAFTRSFVGKTEAAGKYGDRIAPELTLRRALATGAEAGAVQFADIEKATRFLSSRGLQDDGAIQVVMEAQDRFLRLAAAEAINPETGKVNPDRLRKFMQKNEILMNRFPTVKADLDNAIKTTREASRLELLAKGQNRNMEDNKAFSKILKADGVAVAQQALLSNNMESEIQKLVSVVKRGTTGSGTANGAKVTLDLDPGAAMAGLRSSIYTAAINASTGKNRGELDLNQVKGLLFNPPPGQRSAIQILQDEGVVSAREVGRVKELFGALESIQRSQRIGTAIEVRPDLTDAAIAALTRALGSAGAGFLARTAGSQSPSLVVHGAGAKFAEQVFTKMRVTTARQVLIDAISDPSSGKLELIMKQASRMTPKQVAEQAMQLNAWFVQSGIGIAEEAQDRANQPYTGRGTKELIK